MSGRVVTIAKADTLVPQHCSEHDSSRRTRYPSGVHLLANKDKALPMLATSADENAIAVRTAKRRRDMNDLV